MRRWFQERPSEYPWEQDGLDHVKRLMPNAEPYRAWATFSFTASSGRINECDLLIAVPGGLYLLELKAHPGRVVNHGDTWSFTDPTSGRVRTLRNPLHLTDGKSKDLKSRLEWAARRLRINDRLPRVEPAVFLSDRGLRSELDEVQRQRVYGRDEAAEGLPWIWRDLLSRPPQREHFRITPHFAGQVLPRLLNEIGIRVSTAHLRFGDDWKLKSPPLDSGPTWEDRLAERHNLVRESGRVRIYLTEQQATDERRQAVERAARREYQVLQGITHRGIAQAVQIREHQGGPAILFRHEKTDLRLDSFLAVHGERLTPETRLDMVRQLAEAVRYAHSRSLYHRALAARSVYVSAKQDGSSPVLRVIDWQSAARDFETTMSSSLGASSLGSDLVADTADLYLAPEFDSAYPDPVDLDVFGLGAVAYLIITGEPPAATRSALIERLTNEHGLHLYGVDDAVVDVLDQLVFHATRADTGERLDSAEAFLLGLDQTEQDVAVPETTSPGADPLTAAVGQTLDGDWEVVRALGTGATARAVLVQRYVDLPDGEVGVESRVLKIALDEDKAAVLQAEGRVLDLVGGGAIVQKLDGPRLLGGRTVIDLQFGGGEDPQGGTLGALLRAEGRLSYHQLERFGADLFRALDQLAAHGVRHRDLKPDNFVVYQRADRSKQLMLLDFSLAAASERDVTAGTRGYLDPFLGTPRRPSFDDHAERYAAAVTLHEMASTSRPVWGDGTTDPRTTTDATPTIPAELFEPALRDELTAFFQRAFHREVDQRFDSLRQMEEAWRSVFVVADATTPATTPVTVGLDPRSLEETRDAAALSATLDTPLEAAGLSPRAVSVAQSFDATTVGELLDVRLYEIAKARGAGAVIRKELNRRHKQWSALLVAAPELARDDAVLTIDEMARLLVPRRASRKAEVAVATLGLTAGDDRPDAWATQVELAKRLETTQATVSRNQQAAAKDWAAMGWLAVVRDELVDAVRSAGRVMVSHELAAALRARHGAGGDQPDRTADQAAAVVRAAVEAESWAGHHAEDPDALERGPRLAVLRRRDRVLVALESLPGTEDPSAAELADFAQSLGRKADELAVAEPIPGRGAVVRELRLIPPPEGLAPLADTRLVALAAAASTGALVSPRFELYPRGLDLVTALRVSQAAAGVRRAIGATVEDLLIRVRSRFPEVGIPAGLTYLQLEEMVRTAGFPLEFDHADRRFRPPAREVPRRSLTASSTTAGRTFVIGQDRHDVVRARLSTAVERGGFLALTLRGRNLPGTAAALARSYPVRPVDVAALFLTEFRALVADRGQEWGKVLTTDARFGETGRIPPGLASYVRTCWTRVGEHLTEQGADGTVLFLHDAGLLARYAEAGGHDLLVALQAAARQPARAPHGLWLLCPAASATGTPQLDGHVVEVVDGSERLVLDGDFLDGLRNGAINAA
ncbi:BREX system serine/threonine kinase PglW [Pseudonocardia lacus]|uniref:BREX system serine/threonine kinase PglW n=1 Tax=Pseudonocardia lacus TaxID=2835865 RepID=UPI0027E2A3D4|nr:BREX system serine/threonine kinase PglW [Pseudonocardia lacus]